MANIELSAREVELLKMSVNHCLETCGNKESECTDCEALKVVLTKLDNA